jgi:hypothetical protein
MFRRKTIAMFACALLFGGMAPESLGKMRKSEAKVFIEQEVERARLMLNAKDPKKVLDDPHIVSAMYYSQRFLYRIGNRYGSAYREASILYEIAESIAPDFRDTYVRYLKTLSEFGSDIPSPLASPLDRYATPAPECPACHDSAVDLFTRERSNVYSMTRGIVVLAEDGWDPQSEFSTSSPGCGNAVIVFDPVTERFYRYCHLGTVLVKVRDMVLPGQVIGTVGHSGANASRPGHGGHLHIEIARYDETHHTTVFFFRKQIIGELDRIR